LPDWWRQVPQDCTLGFFGSQNQHREQSLHTGQGSFPVHLPTAFFGAASPAIKSIAERNVQSVFIGREANRHLDGDLAGFPRPR